jgi:8-oxo-dGTP pyrophosphatase MutT (NUDIX family)
VLDALKREIHEETGLTVQDAQFVRYGELIGNANFCAGRHMVFLDFLSRSFSGDIRLEKRELDGYEWIPIAEALGKQLTPPTRELLGYLTRPANT